MAAFLGRHPVFAALLVALVALLALALLWHLVAMDHGYPTGMLGGCIVVAAVMLLAVAPHRATSAWLPMVGPAALVLEAATGRAPRPPPAHSVLETTVLLR